MKKVIGKKVWININDRGRTLNSLYKNCHYREEPEQYNQLICTDDFDKAFDFIKSNNLRCLSATSIGKIKIIHYTNLDALADYIYFKFNFKSLVVCEEFIDCSNDFSLKGLLEELPAEEFVEYCNDKGLGVRDIIR